MRRAFKFRAYPTRPQQDRAARLLADHCDLYNAALTERREAWRMRRTNISYGAQSAQLKDIRPADPGRQGRHSFTAQQQTLRRLDTVFAAFFDGVRAAEIGGKRNQARAKAGLNRSILDAGWAQFTTILTGKAAEAGRRVVLVNPAGTSINCHHCGRRCERPQQRTVICPVHGAIDADVNGARNIASRAGLGSGQAATTAA